MGGTTMMQITNLSLVSLIVITLQLTFRLGDYVECVPWETSETAFCQNFVRSAGYLCEEHKLYTDDGFALLVHRVGIAPPSAEGGGSFADVGDSQSNLKLALSDRVRKRHASRLTPGMKVGNSNQISGARKGDLVSQRTQPFQLDKTSSHSDSGQQIPVEGGATVGRTRGGDAPDSPENLPIDLPPHWVANPTIEDENSSSERPFVGLGAPTKTSLLDVPDHPEPIDKTLTTTSSTPPLLPTEPYTTFRGPELPPSPDNLPLVPAPPKPIEWILGSPPSKTAPSPDDIRPSVLLLHHELLNGDSWFKEVSEDEPSSFLPFLLADDGFDVWVGHGRATYWGHDHLFLDSSDRTYWNWSWDEIAEHDLPTLLVYLHQVTRSKVHVVGVSQSAVVAVATATKPDVASLMRSLVLIGPNIYHGSAAPDEVQNWAATFAKVTEGPDSSSVSGQFNISRYFEHPLSLGGPASMISGPDCCISKSLTLFDNGWDGTTSYKNFQHFEQGVLTNTFQRYDYGSPSRNQEAYGQPAPPAYSPAKIPADLPLQIIYGGNDFFSSPGGVQELLVVTPRLPSTVYLPLYAHFDLSFSSTRNQDVYLPMLLFLRDPGAAI